MNTKIKDQRLSFLEANLDIPNIIGSYFPDWMDVAGIVMCPFHEDTKPSLNISADGKACCHSGACDFKARNIVDLVAKLEGLPYSRTMDMLMAQLIDTIPEAEIKAFERCLEKNKKALDYLETERNLPLGIIHSFRLGYDPKTKRITIPIYDQFGYCRNIRQMGWLEEHRNKALNVKGMGEVRLFPEGKLILERRLLLVEGEFDCLVGRAFGLPCVTWTGGAGSWNSDHEHLFRGKAVWILYDEDEAGIRGSNMCGDKLWNNQKIAAYCKEWTVQFIRKGTGKDLTDISFVDPGHFEYMLREITAFKFPSRTRQQHFCPHCGAEVDKKGRCKR